MPAYTTVITHATGDVFPATDWNTYIRDEFAFMHDQGADLPSAATLINITNQVHRVTGTTTITAITAPAGTGQGGNRLLLKFQSAGCAITAGAAIVLTNGPFVSAANGVIEFFWDATLAGWVEIGRVNGQPGLELDYAQITGAVSITVGATTEGTAIAVITGNSVTYDGTKVRIEFNYPRMTPSGTMVLTWICLRDTTVLGQKKGQSSSTATPGEDLVWYDTPPAGAHTYVVKAFGNGAASCTIDAGAGSAGVLTPATGRVTKG